MIDRETISLVEVFGALNRGVTVVTGNKRLAGVTFQAFEKSAINNGLEAWPTPDILPWTAWLQRAWEEVVFSGVATAPELLLTSQQEQRIWEDIVTESAAGQHLQQVSGTVRHAQEAWQLIQSWRLSLTDATFRYNSDSTAFFEWASRFEAKCMEKGWLSLARLSDELQRSILAGDLPTPAELMLIGFDELTPQQQCLFQTLVESDCDVRWMHLAGKESKKTRIGCVDVRQEATTMARWVRQRIDENPETLIGVVVPELASQRDIVIHALDEILVPHALQPGHQYLERPFNISLGPPLSTYPIISTACKLLGLLAPTISLEDAGRLLRSPFIAGWERKPVLEHCSMVG